MNPILLGSIVAIILIIRSMRRTRSHQTYEVLPPQHKLVEVEVIDEMTKEKVLNLYEEQDTYNAKISHLIRENKSLQADINDLDKRIRKNLDEVRTTMIAMPTANIKTVIAGCEEANKNLLKHKLRLEGYIINNQEKIVKYKQKSNEVSNKIQKIGKEIWEQRQRM